MAGNEVSTNNFKEKAVAILGMVPEKQKKEIDTLFKNSIIDALNVAAELVNLAKEAQANASAGCESYISLCETTVSAIKATCEDGVVSEEEKENVKKLIMQILNSADNARKENNEISKEMHAKNVSAATKTALGVAGIATVGRVLLFIVNKLCKK